MNRTRSWIYRILIVLGVGLMIISWLLPWWGANIESLMLDNAVVIHPYGLDASKMTGYASYIRGAEMPGWFALCMWTYLGLAIAALLAGAFLKNKDINLFGKKLNLSRWLIGIVGFSYAVVVIVAYVYATMRVQDFGLDSLVGRKWVQAGGIAETSWISSSLKIGYWLACGTGLYFIILALFQNKIMGKK
jgi:hypothetical protein